MTYRKWTDDQLRNAVLNSNNISQVVKNIGLKPQNPGNRQSISKRINLLKLDTSHFSSKIFGVIRTGKIPLENILVENSTYNTRNLKDRLIKGGLLINKCYDCGITHWNNKKLSLQLDHINGISNDNRLENLRILCPNCHSLTQTFSRGTRRKVIYKCSDCNIEVTKNSKRCYECSRLYKINKDLHCKTNWPTIDKLIEMVNKIGYTKTGKFFEVSDSAVRKRIRIRTRT